MRIGNSIGVSSRQFIKSSSTDPYFANVVLLMHMDGADNGTTFTDVKGKVVTRFNAVTKTAEKKFGTASGYFDGTGDYLQLDGSADFAFGTGDFTIECWVNPVSTTGMTLYDGRPTGVSSGAYPTLLRNGSVLSYYASGADRITATLPSTGVWSHIAVCRASGTTRMFVNGAQVGSSYADATNYINGANRPTIGVVGDNTSLAIFNGYIDDYRVTKGIGRYSGTSFTVPTAAYPDA